MKLLLITLTITNSLLFYSQNNVGIGTSNPNPHSILDLESSDKGILVPRITTISRTTLGTSLTTSDNGMLVYDKNLLTFFYWDGTQWVQIGNNTDNQNLTGASLTGTSLQIDIENGNSTTVDLSPLQDGVDDADNNPNNEIQTISKIGDSIILSLNGGSVIDQDSQLSESQVDNYTNNNGYLTTFTEIDGVIGNEYNTGVSLTGTTLNVTDGGGNQSVDLSSLMDGTGTDNQTLSLSGLTISISNGNSITIPNNVPAGAVMAFNLNACPTGWIKANGQNSTPDLRGEFIRGLDDGRGVDIGRTLTSTQSDELKSHSHKSPWANDISGSGSPTLQSSTLYLGNVTSNGGTAAGFRDGTNIGDLGNTNGSTDHVLRTTLTGGNETRPRNIALLYCIKQ